MFGLQFLVDIARIKLLQTDFVRAKFAGEEFKEEYAIWRNSLESLARTFNVNDFNLSCSIFDFTDRISP